MSTLWLTADWPAPVNVRTCITTRLGGCSQGVWKGFNLGDHVGDDPVHVAANRAELERVLCCCPAWLTQVHGTEVCKADPAQVLEADASWTDQPGIACTIMTADCLPALFCTRDGQRVAAAHAGWRGMLDGVLENTVQALESPPETLTAWLGPAISQAAFEVGSEVREAFVSRDPGARNAFQANPRGRWQADLVELARQRLAIAGVRDVYGGKWCTYADQERFYSYRRDPACGRLVSFILLK